MVNQEKVQLFLLKQEPLDAGLDFTPHTPQSRIVKQQQFAAEAVNGVDPVGPLPDIVCRRVVIAAHAIALAGGPADHRSLTGPTPSRRPGSAQ